ncbi:MAG: hypothetical protein ABSC11_11600 [Smithella sp.]|jgi:hypothetical protein
MYPKIMIKQILDFNRKAFEDSFNVVAFAEEQSEKILSLLREESLFFPEQSKKIIEDWVKTYKNGWDSFKTNMDSRFKFIEDCLLKVYEEMESSLKSADEKTAPIRNTGETTRKASAGKKAAPRKRAAIKK